MAGTIEGGEKARDTNIKRHGKDFYAKIGAKGGKLGTTGGFAADRALARSAGKKGGEISRRGHVKGYRKLLSGKFEAYTRHNNKNTRLGIYDTESEAIEAHKKALKP